MIHFDQEFFYLLNSIGRTALQNLSAVIPFYIIMGTLCKRRKPIWIVVLLMSMKFLVLSALWLTLFAHYFSEHPLWGIGSVFLSIFFVIWNFAILFYSYEGSYIKVGIGSIISELLAVPFAYGAMIITNLLAEREKILGLMGWMKPIDVLMPIISVAAFFLCYPIMKNILLPYQSWEFSHKHLAGVLLIAYVFMGSLTSVHAVNNDFDASIKTSLIFIGVISIGLLASALWFVKIWKNDIQLEHEYLLQMRKVVESQYLLTNRQILLMEKNQKKMEETMQQLEVMKLSVHNSETIQAYLSSLQSDYENIKYGIYTDQWELDALLCKEAQKCENEGIAIDFLVQEYQKSEKSQLHYRIAWNLLETAFHENCQMPKEKRFLKFHMATVKGQTIYNVECASQKKKRIVVWRWKHMIEQQDGYLNYRWGDGKVYLVVIN